MHNHVVHMLRMCLVCATWTDVRNASTIVGSQCSKAQSACGFNRLTPQRLARTAMPMNDAHRQRSGSRSASHCQWWPMGRRGRPRTAPSPVPAETAQPQPQRRRGVGLADGGGGGQEGLTARARQMRALPLISVPLVAAGVPPPPCRADEAEKTAQRGSCTPWSCLATTAAVAAAATAAAKTSASPSDLLVITPAEPSV